jgi:hypothetical protein
MCIVCCSGLPPALPALQALPQLRQGSHRHNPGLYFSIFSIISSVGDPDSAPNPDLWDQYAYRSPGSFSTRYGSGSGSCDHQAKIVRKTFIPPDL